MYITILEIKVAEFEKAENEDIQDTIGEGKWSPFFWVSYIDLHLFKELLNLYDKIAKFGASQMHDTVLRYSIAQLPTPPALRLAPSNQALQIARSYSTSRSPVSMFLFILIWNIFFPFTSETLPRFAVDDMRDWYISR